MSLVDVSKSMDELASAIARKNAELEKLKTEYTQKLRIVDSYLRQINPQNLPTLTPEQFLEQAQKPVSCPNCSENVYDLQQSKFVLIPAKGLELQDEEEPKSEKPEQTSPPETETHHKKGHSKKRTCSYCNKPGHSRARCFTRLSTEPNVNKSV